MACGLHGRELLKLAMLTLGASSALNACSKTSGIGRIASFGVPDHRGQGPADMRPWARYPEKADLIMLADRPPLLETPMRYFASDLTPNDAYFCALALRRIANSRGSADVSHECRRRRCKPTATLV